jgi:probable rRNA maturation factor
MSENPAQNVTVLRRTRRGPRFDSRRLRREVGLMLEFFGLGQAELCISLTSAAQIRVLNRTYRNKDKPTDVLAFPLATPQRPKPKRGKPRPPRQSAATPALPPDEPRMLGDVVISLEAAESQANSRSRPVADEVRFLAAHALLHLLGYDHDTKANKQAMSALTRRVVRAAKLENPAVSPAAARRRPAPGPGR